LEDIRAISISWLKGDGHGWRRVRRMTARRRDGAAWIAGLLILVGSAPLRLDAQPSSWRRARIDAELGDDLAGWAARLTGRSVPTANPLPTFMPLPDDALANTVCPERPIGCRGLVAAYDTDRRRIVYRASLDMRDPTDQSFIVHELVHWLQHVERGPDFEASCESVLAAEREAYAAQNLYLIRFKQWQRVGEVLRFTFCNADARQAGEPTVRFDASTGPITATHPGPVASGPR
jgi:hypothetical protein